MIFPPLPRNLDRVAAFPIVQKWHFFNHAAVAPLCHRAAEALRSYAQQSEHDAYLTGRWYKLAEQVRSNAAKVINSNPREIAFVKNTSEGLAFVANGLSWKSGDEIVSTAVEYPANVYPWMDLEQRFGVRLVRVPEEADGRIALEKLIGAVTGRTRMVAISHVEYASGFRNDLQAIGELCRSRGILFCVDAIQSVGALPVDVEGMKIDFLSADGHKWMLGPEGLGIFYCRKELIGGVHPEVGWMNVVNATDFDTINFTLRADAKRFECGAYNIPGVLALGAALEVLLEVGIETVWRRIDWLNNRLAEGLLAKGYRVMSPREREEERSGILSFASPTHDHQRLFEEFEKKRIVVALRSGRLRASPHFYNEPEQIDALLDALPGH